MKFILALAALVASACAQGIAIGAPAEGTTITRGNNFTVEVDRPDTLTGSKEIAIVIALESCAGRTGGCASFDVTQVLGQVLYSGSYNPQFSTPPDSKPPHQDFSVMVPPTFQQGEASLSVSHFALVGAGPFPLLEVKNITLNVQ